MLLWRIVAGLEMLIKGRMEEVYKNRTRGVVVLRMVTVGTPS